MAEKAPEQDVVTYVDLPEGRGAPIIDRGPAGDIGAQRAIAIAPLTAAEHVYAVDRLSQLSQRLGDMTPGNAEVRLGQAASYAVSVAAALGRQPGPHSI